MSPLSARPLCLPQKRMRLKQLPPVLCLHLKRFKYIEQLGRWVQGVLRLLHCAALRWARGGAGGGRAKVQYGHLDRHAKGAAVLQCCVPFCFEAPHLPLLPGPSSHEGRGPLPHYSPTLFYHAG